MIRKRKKYDENHKLKVAMIGHKRIPSREGGVEVVVEEISTRLVRLGHEVTAFNRKGNHVSGKEFNIQDIENIKKEYKGIEIKSIPTIDIKGISALISSCFATIMALLGKFDCIHYHAEGPAAMLILPHLLGKKTIVTIHGLDWKRAKWNKIAVRYLKLGEKIAAKYADSVIVLSKNMQEYFKEVYGRDTILIPNGIEKPEIKYPKVINNKWNLKKDEYILYLGRIVPEKGLDYLIDAFSMVTTSKKLIIAGGSSDTDEFMESVKRKAQKDERIIFTGFVEGEVLQELFSNAYIYVLPSDLEGMPISLLEAMSYSNCCLVSDIDECVEVIEDVGVTFKKSDVADLRDKLQLLCNNYEEVKKYKDKSSGFICNKYNWNKVVNKTIEVYKS